jgi:hypothetical protein
MSETMRFKMEDGKAVGAYEMTTEGLVQILNDRADQIRRLEIENATLTGKLAAMECFPAPAQTTRWPSPEEAAKYRQDWLARNTTEWVNWANATEKPKMVSAMAALFDWIKKGCPDE